MTTRRTFIGAVTLGVLAAPLTAVAQSSGKVYRIGFLIAGAPAQANPPLDAFKDALRGLGYVEGKNLVIEFRFAEGNVQRLPGLAQELVDQHMAIILPTSTPATFAASQATRTIPIVMTGTLDAEAVGLVQSLARPGGNITGLTQISLELMAKRLALLKEAAPGLSRLGFLTGFRPRPPADPPPGPAGDFERSGQLQVERISRAMEEAAQRAGMEVLRTDGRGPEEIKSAFASLAAARVRGLYVLESPFLALQRALIADLALKAKLPSISGGRNFVEAGGLMSYTGDLREAWRRAAFYVDKILRSAKPADLPVEQPTKFELVINLKAAKALGLTLPQSLLQRADEVIQ